MRCLLLLIPGIAIATSAFALPATCTSTTYDIYISQGSCQDGDATYSNFSSLSFTNSGGVATIPPTDLLVIPGGSTLDPTLTFEYVNANGDPTPETVSSSGQIFSMGLTYQVVVTGGDLASIQMAEVFSNTAPGNVAATKNADLDGGPMFTSTVNDGGVSNPADTSLAGNVVPTSGTGTWNIQDTVSLQAQSGSATQNSFENLYTLTESSTVPEPSTMLLIGSALLLVGLARRRSGTSVL